MSRIGVAVNPGRCTSCVAQEIKRTFCCNTVQRLQGVCGQGTYWRHRDGTRTRQCLPLHRRVAQGMRTHPIGRMPTSDYGESSDQSLTLGVEQCSDFVCVPRCQFELVVDDPGLDHTWHVLEMRLFDSKDAPLGTVASVHVRAGLVGCSRAWVRYLEGYLIHQGISFKDGGLSCIDDVPLDSKHVTALDLRGVSEALASTWADDFSLSVVLHPFAPRAHLYAHTHAHARTHALLPSQVSVDEGDVPKYCLMQRGPGRSLWLERTTFESVCSAAEEKRRKNTHAGGEVCKLPKLGCQRLDVRQGCSG